MITQQDRTKLAYLGLDITEVESRLTVASGQPMVVVETRLGFLNTQLVVETSTCKQYLLDQADDDFVYAYPAPRFGRARPIRLADLTR